MIKVLKTEIKAIVEKIKTSKLDLVNYQRQNNGCDGGFYFTLYKLRYECRHKHIAYCLMKGRSYDVIERPSENNKPNMEYIKEIIDAHTAKQAIEDVCACAQ